MPIRAQPPDTTTAAFLEFWAAYPRRVAKGDAEKAWGKMRSVDLHVLMAALVEQKQSVEWQRDSGQFVPYPATWLNGRRWEDEVVRSLDPRSQPGYVDLGL